MKLTQNFSFDELTDTSYVDMVGDNKKQAIQFIPKITMLCIDLLEPVRSHFGPVRVTSGFRCNELNKRVGSSSMSQHTNQGDIYTGAADIQLIDGDLEKAFAWAAENLRFHQLVYEAHDSTRWVHIGMPTGERDMQVFRYNPQTKVREWLRMAEKN